MANYNQAPLLLRRGEKQINKNDLFAMRPHNLEAAICCCLGNRDIVALKVMLFFTGNSNEGDFRVSQKVIFDRMNISEKTYYNARKKLEEMKWIEYVEEENAIYINYDNIYADYKNYLKEKKGGCNDSLISSSSKDRPVLKDLPQQSLTNGVGGCNDSPQDYHKDRHNNISNNISNSKINKKSCGAGAAIAAPPQVIPQECADIVDDFNNGKIGKNEAKHLIEEWWYREINKIIELNPNLNKYHLVDDGSEEYKKAKEIEVIATTIYNSFNEKSENYYI